MDTLTRPLPYYPCLSGWTLVILVVLKVGFDPTHQLPLMVDDAKLFSLFGLLYLAIAFWVGMIIGIAAFMLNEAFYRGWARLRGREIL